MKSDTIIGDPKIASDYTFFPDFFPRRPFFKAFLLSIFYPAVCEHSNLGEQKWSY